VTTYSTINSTFPANSWQPTYTRGVVTKVSAPIQEYMNNFYYNVGWDGTKMYVFESLGTYSYNPDTDTWAIASGTGLGSGQAVWTGTEFIVLNSSCTVIRKFNPATNAWVNTSTVNKPSLRSGYSATWTGTRLVVWGGYASGSALNTGGIYDPVTDTWTI